MPEVWHHIIAVNLHHSVEIMQALEAISDSDQGKGDLICALMPRLKDILAQGEEGVSLLMHITSSHGRGSCLVRSMEDKVLCVKKRLQVFEGIVGRDSDRGLEREV